MYRYFSKIMSTALLVFLISPTILLAWTLEKGGTWVVTQERVDGLLLDLRCDRSSPGHLQFTLSGEGVPQTSGVMLWIEQADGRTDRQPVDVKSIDNALTGKFFVSDLILNNFGNAAKMEMTIAGTGTRILVSDMKGTGAARLAILERCGM